MPGIRQFFAGPGLAPLLIKATVGSAGLRIAGMIFGFGVGLVLARELGAEGYGIYGVAMTVVALMTVVAEFGLPWLIIRETAASQVEANWGKLRGVLDWSIRVSVLNSAAVIVLFLLFLVTSDREFGSVLHRTMLAGLALVPLVALANLLGASLRGLQHLVWGQLPEVLIRPALHCALLFTLYAFAVPLTPTNAMLLGALSTGIVLCLSWLMLWKLMPSAARIAVPIIESYRWRWSAIPMALSEGVRVLQGHLVILLLGALSTMAMVGIFRVASSMSLLAAVPATLMNVICAPIISRLYRQADKPRLQRVLTWVAAGMSLGTLALTLPFYIWGEQILLLLFGEYFQAANAPLLIICGGNLVASMMGPGAILLTMTGHEKRVTRALVIALVGLSALAAPLIHVYGVNGGALASAISMMLLSAILMLDAYRLLGVDTSLLSLLARAKRHIE